MADSHDLADANSDTFWEEEELDEHESEYFSTDYGAPAHSANENMTDALRFNGEKFIIAAQYIAKQRAKLHHQLRVMTSTLASGGESTSGADSYIVNLQNLEQYIIQHEQELIEFVIGTNMYIEDYHGHGEEWIGTHARHTVTLADQDYFKPYDDRVVYQRTAVAGDGHCGYRAPALRLLGDESLWPALRLVSLHASIHSDEYSLIELHEGTTATYEEIIQNESQMGLDEYLQGLLSAAGERAGIWELVAISKFMQTTVLIFVEDPDSNKQLFPRAYVENGKFKTLPQSASDLLSPNESLWVARIGKGPAEFHWDPLDLGPLDASGTRRGRESMPADVSAAKLPRISGDLMRSIQKTKDLLGGAGPGTGGVGSLDTPFMWRTVNKRAEKMPTTGPQRTSPTPKTASKPCFRSSSQKSPGSDRDPREAQDRVRRPPSLAGDAQPAGKSPGRKAFAENGDPQRAPRGREFDAILFENPAVDATPLLLPTSQQGESSDSAESTSAKHIGRQLRELQQKAMRRRTKTAKLDPRKCEAHNMFKIKSTSPGVQKAHHRIPTFGTPDSESAVTFGDRARRDLDQELQDGDDLFGDHEDDGEGEGDQRPAGDDGGDHGDLGGDGGHGGDPADGGGSGPPGGDPGGHGNNDPPQPEREKRPPRIDLQTDWVPRIDLQRDYDERAGTEVTCKSLSLQPQFDVNNATTTDAWLEDHVLAILKKLPNRQADMDAVIAYAHQQHRKTVDEENLGIDDNSITFEVRDVSDLEPHELNFRMKYFLALMDAMPAFMKQRFIRLCRHGNLEALQRDTENGEDDVRSTASGMTTGTQATVADPFERKSVISRRTAQKSQFYTPECLLWCVFLHCYRGCGKQRVALQKRVCRTLATATDHTPVSQKYFSVHYANYESEYETWTSLGGMCVSFGIGLPDASILWEYYRYCILGGEGATGVLSQFEPVKRYIDSIEDKQNIGELRASDGPRIRNLLGEVHNKVLSILKTREAKTPSQPPGKKHKTKPHKDADNGTEDARRQDAQGGIPKGGKKGDGGQGQGGQGGSGNGGKQDGGKQDGGKQGGKDGGPKARGKGKGIPLDQRPPEFFTEIMPDGYQRGLCHGFIVNGACPNGQSCIFGKHGGHPARITPEMTEVCKKRRVARDEARKKWAETKAAFQGQYKPNGGAHGGKGDAELKAALEAGRDP